MRLPVTKNQMAFLKSIGISDKEYSAEEINEEIIDAVSDYLMQHGFKQGQQETNEIGDMCESIIDVLTE